MPPPLQRRRAALDCCRRQPERHLPHVIPAAGDRDGPVHLPARRQVGYTPPAYRVQQPVRMARPGERPQARSHILRKVVAPQVAPMLCVFEDDPPRNNKGG